MVQVIRLLGTLFVLVIGTGFPITRAAQVDPSLPLPHSSYYVYVCAESEDEVAVVRYGPAGLEVIKTVTVGSYPTETEGPHGVALDPGGQYWYVSIAHGFPFGSVHKYRTGTDEWIGDVTLGMFPATLTVSATTGLLYVVNFNLHGGMEPSSVSAVEVDTMTEVERIETGMMPHGSRLSRDGTRHYSVNMMGGDLVELDALGFEVSRRLSLGEEVQPTWVTEPTTGGMVYVTGNNVGKVFEVDLDGWQVQRIFETGAGPYNLAVTPDESTLVATYKNDNSVGFWDLASGEERARVETSRTIPHGVTVTPDGAYAFVTLEGVGSDPGTVEVYDLATPRRVATVDIGKQAGGIAFWKVEGP
ncbi:MAG: YncE family protein [Vicinamibacterales bacterium]